MSASQSFLSSPDYGYDYVVAVTQDSINATAVTFLKTKQSVGAFKSALIRFRQLSYNSIERTAQ